LQFAAIAMAENIPLVGLVSQTPDCAKCEHVDLERGMIFLPDSKTGRKPISLSAAAAEILSALPCVDGNP
jgi:hypothetical protein